MPEHSHEQKRRGPDPNIKLVEAPSTMTGYEHVDGSPAWGTEINLWQRLQGALGVLEDLHRNPQFHIHVPQLFQRRVTDTLREEERWDVIGEGERE